MVKWQKQDFVDDLNDFFGKVGLTIDWSKLTVKDLQSLHGLLGDHEKVIDLFDLTAMKDGGSGSVGSDAITMLTEGGLLSGGLGGNVREGVTKLIDAGVDGAVDSVVQKIKTERPLRTSFGGGQLIQKLLSLTGDQK